MKKILVTAKTVEDAIQSGLRQLDTTKDRVKVTVLAQPSKGLFGLLGAKDAKVELEMIPNPLDEIISFLGDVFRSMNLDISIEQMESEDGYTLNLYGDELGILIGRRGQTLDALQYLTNIVANRFSDSHIRIILDAENFRERRKKTLEELSERLASRVVRSKKEVVLEPMSPLERKIIHSSLQDHPTVKTYSKGEDPNRKIVITLK